MLTNATKHAGRVALGAVLIISVALVMLGCGGGEEPRAIDANGCEKYDQPESKSGQLEVPSNVLDPEQRHFVEFDTNCGRFTIELDAKQNPRTAASFAFVAESGLYNDTWFHRIVEGFVVQGGDPTGDGSGGSGYDITEPPTGKYKIGTVAMAKSASELNGTSSSQFYIVIGKDGTDLPPEYAIAGRVSTGMDVVMKIANYAPEPGDPAATPTGVAVIKSADVKTAP